MGVKCHSVALFAIFQYFCTNLIYADGIQVSITLALTDLAYADDIALFGDSYEAVQEMVNGVHRFANAVGLRINAAKTKVLPAQIYPTSRGTITMDGVPLEEVSGIR